MEKDREEEKMGMMSFFSKKTDTNYYSKVGYKVLNENALQNNAKVTVVVPVYNAIDFLEKTVDSVIIQNLGFQHITCILVDDGSTDGSKNIMENYSRMYKNIVSVFLEQNTGTPAYPRNLGAHLAKSTYIFYLDADDWLHPEGLLTLHDLLEETKGDYAVGKTIQVDSKSEKIIGRYESSRIRHNVSPFSIKHFFYHLGPRARMVRLNLIRENQIRYPEMKFAEDKQFFIDVILAAGNVSTTTQAIYYLNRIEDNNSLTKQTDVMEKMDSNIAVLKHVLSKQIDPGKEKFIINRLIEFDSITRLFDRKHFVKSGDKQAYFAKFNEVMAIFKKAKRPYSVEDTIIKPINKKYYELAMNKDYETLALLAEWSKNNGESSFETKEGKPYQVAHLKNGDKIDVPIEVTAVEKEINRSGDSVDIFIELTGHQIPTIEGLLLSSRESILKTYLLEDVVVQNGNNVTVHLNKTHMDIDKGGYVFTLVYNDYERLFVAKKTKDEAIIEFNQKKQVKFYKTIKDNLSVKVTSQ